MTSDTGARPRLTDFVLAEETTAGLKRIASHDDAALHALLASGVAALLHVRAGDRYVILGQPLHLDEQRVEEPLTWVLPLRCAVNEDDSFRTLAPRMRDAISEAVKHQDYPLQILADHLGMTGDQHRNPFFDVAIRFEGLHEQFPFNEVPVPITFSFAHHEHNLRLSVCYNSSLCDATTVDRAVRQLCRVLDQIVANPNLPLNDVLLRDPDDDTWLAAINNTGMNFDNQLRIHDWLERQAAQTPEAIAVISNGRHHTYAELDLRANQLAWTLRAKGVGADVVVSVLADRCFDMLVAILGVLKAGGAYLPIEPTYPKARIDYLLTDSCVKIVLGHAPYLDGLPSEIDPINLDMASSYANRTDAVDRPASSTDLAYVIYTSGSTGSPKGVAVEHRSAINRIAWMQRVYPIGPGDVILHKTPIAFDVSVWELFWWMSVGATVCLLQPRGEKNPDAILTAIEQHGITTMHFVPSMLDAFLDYLEGVGTPRLAGLRQVFASGEALGPHLVQRFHRLLTTAAGTRLINLYGPTEATVDVSHHLCDDPQPTMVPIGKPIDNIRLYVVDDRLRVQPAGVPGELCIAGVGLARGYLHRETLTRERFVEHPFPGEKRIYRTGDLAQWLPDGSLEYLGRIDHQVKVRGFRVEPGEIEETLRSHPAVRHAVVVPRTSGAAQTVLCGYVVADLPVTQDELAEHLRHRLPEYMVPAQIMLLDKIPLTPNGKLDRQALPQPQTRPAVRTDHLGPRNETETLLAKIWVEVLDLEEIDIRDNFFAIGGDSIHFVVVLAKARAGGLTFTFQEFFQHPTIADLSAYLSGRTNPEPDPQDQRFASFELISNGDRSRLTEDVEDAYPLSMLQAGLIYQSEIMRGTAQYHDIISYLIQSSFNPELFSAAVRLVAERNSILRTTYHLSGFSEPLQVVHRNVPLPLTVVDLRGLDEDAQQRWYESWLVEEKGRAFSWEEPATLIFLYVQVLADNLYRYNISLHNSTLDGRSINLIHAEVFDIYHRLCTGRELPPPPADNHLRNFIGLERRSLESAADAAFWAGVLNNRPRTSIPATEPAGQPFSVVMSHFDVPLGLSERIIQLAESLAVPVKSVLLAAHVRVLSLVNDCDDVLTGYEHSGRPELDGADRAIGMFLNTVPFRCRLTGGTWSELIRQVYQSEVDFLPHRRYPMAKMKQDLQTREGLFSTVFNFTHFYLLKELKRLPEFDLLNIQVQAETEFILRAEFSRHFFNDNVQLSLHYHANVISDEQAARLGGYYLNVLERMTDDPHGSHAAERLLSSDELRQLALDRSTHATLTTGIEESETAADETPMAFMPLATATQKEIADVWAHVLGVPVEKIGRHDNFFTLGGNSLAAMRVVMGLRSAVSLVDVMRHPQLDELATTIDSNRLPADIGHLRLLSAHTVEAADHTGPACTLVCLPFAAAHPSNFLDLAAAMALRAPDIAVYAVEYPGHNPNRLDESFEDTETTARMVVDELTAALSGPVVLWGHCFGASVTVEVARLLEERNVDLRHVFLGAKLLPKPELMREAIGYVGGMTDSEIIQWLVEQTGLTRADGLEPDQVEFICRMFRHDVVTGHSYLLTAYETPGSITLSTPVTFVGAKDDRVIADYRYDYAEWRRVATDVRLRALNWGGHYFTRTRATEVAAMVVEEWSKSHERWPR
jgi:amino acid adenylation domain-containing protein